ncbi:protein LAZ1 [Tanacetum coccineum]
MSRKRVLTLDKDNESVDKTKYRGMIGSLLYLTASRLDIMFSVCLCTRFQEDPKVPVVAYSEDGLSLIATQIGKPVMLDAFTSTMCADPWEEGDDGKNTGWFTTVTNRKKKGKQPQTNHARKIEGLKLNKPKATFVYRPKISEPARTMETNSDDIDLFTLKNQFDFTSILTLNEDFESEVEEGVCGGMILRGKHSPSPDFKLLAIATWNIGCVRSWDRSSNANLCTKGCRIILGWNLDDVNVMVGLSHLARELLSSVWSVNVDGHKMYQVVSKLKALKKTALDLNPNDLSLREDEAVYVQAFSEAKLDEERFLKQKAKIEWLEVGDSNSAYFHKKVRDSFSNMVRPVTDEEVKAAMFSIGDERAPGPDGFSSAFFKKGWDIVGLDVCHAIRDFFVNGRLLKEINHTFIALIPKILTNRIIDGIKKVVSDNQSAFVLGGRISDNILITQELMHNYHRNRGPPRCAFKIDIQKAYDTVDWRFLGCVLKYFGFHPLMIKWIMACVTSTSFSLNINGDIHGFFKGKRGLRQGDPLSPYLFTLIMEVLTLMIKRRVNLSGVFRYHKNCEELQLVNVCFADDLFIFARGDLDSARVIMESLDEFKLTSGLVPSIPKSTAFFCNVPNHVKISILNIMPFAEGNLPVKYLGVPLISSRLLNKDCKVLVEKAKN